MFASTRVRVASALSAAALVWFLWGAAPQATVGADGPAKAEPKAKAAGDDAGLRAAGKAYLEAYRKGDIKALLALWDDDAEYVQDDGTVVRGKKDLGALFEESLKATKGYSVDVKVDSVKFVTPDVVVESGSVETVSPDKEMGSSRFTAVWARKDGKWVMTSVHDSPNRPAATEGRPFDRLRQLEWLVGEWVDAAENPQVKLTVKWGAGKAGIEMHYDVRKDDGTAFTVDQRIGWDPVEESLRSWLFDSDGGFAQAWWTRQGNTWSSEPEGVLPDGRLAASQNSLKAVDENTFEWKSVGRQVDGTPIPDVQVKFTRRKAAP